MKLAPSSFQSFCYAAGLERPLPEYRFAPPRRWRFDWAFVNAKVAIEVQGGLFVAGRHTRGAALIREYEKINHAAMLGWRILFVTPQQFSSGEAIQLASVAIGVSK